ncbi:MAG: hypothetical protein IKX20_05755 [Paludibacteraceae bacterium]|nr:hypothetical protein [Paludibacteraceae bacterium]
MPAEYSANAVQTVEVNAPVIFTESPVPCNRGLIFHRDESGIFRLANNANSNGCSCGCGCRRLFETLYSVTFHANIAIADDGTVEPIQLTVAIDGEPDVSSTMIVTPAAVGDYQNVGAEIFVAVPSLCGCESISVRNTSSQAIDVQNANLTISYLGVRRVF